MSRRRHWEAQMIAAQTGGSGAQDRRGCAAETGGVPAPKAASSIPQFFQSCLDFQPSTWIGSPAFAQRKATFRIKKLGVLEQFSNSDQVTNPRRFCGARRRSERLRLKPFPRRLGWPFRQRWSGEEAGCGSRWTSPCRKGLSRNNMIGQGLGLRGWIS
jgi:hypothetical protein